MPRRTATSIERPVASRPTKRVPAFFFRTKLPGRIARVLFYVDADQRMVLLPGFIKKSQKTPDAVLTIARARKAEHEKDMDNAQR